jgi:hypothetical protein
MPTRVAVGAATIADPLRWATDCLWADDVDVRFEVPGTGGSGYLAHPSVADPEILVPSGTPRVAAAIARRTSDARSPGERLRNLVIELMASTGLLTVLAGGRRLSLHVGAGGDDPDRSLPAHVATVLGLDDIRYAVTLGKERYNRKPVLTVFDGDGRIRAYVKVGVDSFTDLAAVNETCWLRRVARSAPAGFVAPEVLWSGVWRGRQVLVSAPLGSGRLPVRRRVDRPPAGLVEAVAGLTDPATVSVADTAPIHEAEHLVDPRLATAVAAVLDRHGDRRVRVGCWHGDLTPWNIASHRNRPPSVWDWEAAAEGRPIGADLLHSRVMVPTHLRGVSPGDAMAALDPADVAGHQASAAARAATPARPLPGIGEAALRRLAPHD